MSKETLTAIAKSAILSEIYKDVAQPSARRIGASLESLTKITVSPISIIDWGFEKSADWLRQKIELRFARTPSEVIVEPKTSVVFKALSHIAISHDSPELRDLYAELLLKSMDTRTADLVHPAYFQVIEQLAPKEALILVGLNLRDDQAIFIEKITPWSYSSLRDKEPSIEDQFASFCRETVSGSAEQAGVWLNNLCRLGLLSINSFSEAVFRPEEADHKSFREAQVDNYEHRSLEFPDFGKIFIAACAPKEDDVASVPSSA